MSSILVKIPIHNCKGVIDEITTRITVLLLMNLLTIPFKFP